MCDVIVRPFYGHRRRSRKRPMSSSRIRTRSSNCNMRNLDLASNQRIKSKASPRAIELLTSLRTSSAQIMWDVMYAFDYLILT